MDSRTTGRNKAGEAAESVGVPIVANDLFLDEIYTATHVDRQLRKLSRLLGKQQDTIVIGHVGPPGRITAAALRDAIERLQDDTKFVRVSEPVPLWR